MMKEKEAYVYHASYREYTENMVATAKAYTIPYHLVLSIYSCHESEENRSNERIPSSDLI